MTVYINTIINNNNVQYFAHLVFFMAYRWLNLSFVLFTDLLFISAKVNQAFSFIDKKTNEMFTTETVT